MDLRDCFLRSRAADERDSDRSAMSIVHLDCCAISLSSSSHLLVAQPLFLEQQFPVLSREWLFPDVSSPSEQKLYS